MPPTRSLPETVASLPQRSTLLFKPTLPTMPPTCEPPLTVPSNVQSIMLATPSVSLITPAMPPVWFAVPVDLTVPCTCSFCTLPPAPIRPKKPTSSCASSTFRFVILWPSPSNVPVYAWPVLPMGYQLPLVSARSFSSLAEMAVFPLLTSLANQCSSVSFVI